MSRRRRGVAADMAGIQGVLVVAAVLVAASLLGLFLSRSGRRMRSAKGASPLDAADLGQALGERATLLQFSTAFCQPCRATRQVLAGVAGDVPGVAHVEIDAESRLDLVRRLDVRRTPTVLVLDSAGRVIRRASGQPRTADVVAALGQAIPA